MSPSNNYVPITSSQLQFQGTLIHEADPFQVVTFTIRMHHHTTNAGGKIRAEVAQRAIERLPGRRDYLIHEELEKMVAPDAKHVQELTDYFAQYQIKQGKLDKLARSVTYKGQIAYINAAFRVKMGVFQGPNRFTFLAYQGPLSLPAKLSPLVLSVDGITTLLKSEFRLPTSTPETDQDQSPVPVQTPKGYTVRELAKAYNFPTGLNGEGQCIGILELGGRYKESDVKQYFKDNDLSVPDIVTVGDPIDDSSLLNNSEVTLDLQVAGSVAPAAKLVIYYGHSIIEAMRLVVADKKNKPSVLSISWAGSEFNYSQTEVVEMNELFFQATALGITVIAASGDHGAFNSRNFPNVSLPSSHPMVMGCGGTSPVLDAQDELTSTKVWNQEGGKIGSGGGFSTLYQQPGYQAVAVKAYPYAQYGTRGVPDVAASADGTHGYIVVFNGQEMAIGGTSASTPLLAGLVALMNQHLGFRLGFFNHLLYALAGNEHFFQVLIGDNGHYPAAPYWDPATGLGIPRGDKLLAALEKLTALKND